MHISSNIMTRYILATLMMLVISTPASAANFFSAQLDALDEQIERYEEIVEDGGWPKLTSKKKLEPSMTHEAVVTLRKILKITGDYGERSRVSKRKHQWYKRSAEEVLDDQFADPRFYDSKLEEAVKRFQERHALSDDGVVGPATRKAMNVSAIERLAQLHIAKEQIDVFATANADFERGVIVNIPGYTLYMLEDGKPSHHMNVIVGRYKRQTPLFSNQITYLEFNPRWYVPQTIAAEDILPKIQENPDYVQRAGFKLTQDGEQVDATAIDWSTYDQENFPFRLTQRSGRGNALGKVKFMLPNNRAIYLHDTSKHYLFKRGYRALSSGCIRVEDPLTLTKFVLGRGNNMSEEEAASIYESTRRLKGIKLDTPTRVHTVYWTAWIEPDAEQPSFYDDIYRRNRAAIADKKRELEGELRVARK